MAKAPFREATRRKPQENLQDPSEASKVARASGARNVDFPRKPRAKRPVAAPKSMKRNAP